MTARRALAIALALLAAIVPGVPGATACSPAVLPVPVFVVACDADGDLVPEAGAGAWALDGSATLVGTAGCHGRPPVATGPTWGCTDWVAAASATAPHTGARAIARAGPGGASLCFDVPIVRGDCAALDR